MSKLPSILIGSGLTLFIINQPDFFLNKYILISNIGLLMIYVGIIIFVLKLKSLKELTLGNKFVWIPMVVITLSMIISTVLSDATNKMSLIFFAPTLFALYVAARKLGKDVFIPLTYGVVIASVSMVIYGIYLLWIIN